VYINSDYATRYLQQGGVHYWYNASSGTATNSVSFVQAMTLDNSGNLIIGATSQIGSAVLGVAVNTGTSNGFSYKTTTDGAFGALRALNNSGTEKVNIQYDTTNAFMAFRTNNSEAARIDSSGNVGIGITSPTTKLDVSNTGTSTTVSFKLGASDSNSNSVRLVTTQNSDGSATFNVNAGGNGSTSALIFQQQGAERMRIDANGTLLIGTTSNPASSASLALYTLNKDAVFGQNIDLAIGQGLQFNQYYNPNTTNSYALATGYVGIINLDSSSGAFLFRNSSSSQTAGANVNSASTERMRIDSSGNLLLGRTSQQGTEKFGVKATGINPAIIAQSDSGSTDYTVVSFNTATTGDNKFVGFFTETSPTLRGSITYNRAGGLTVYNTTSDYRAKDIIGSVTNSGETIDSVPVYMGKMKGATQERPMFIAHETPAYAHTGEKDAVDKDGNPIYQQIDASVLVPVMWAEIQSLRKRILTLENK
jgi:hypothetical protein